MGVGRVINYFNPCSEGFSKAADTFHYIKTWQKVVAVVSSIFAGLLTLWAGGIGGFALFRLIVEKFDKKNREQSYNNIFSHGANLRGDPPKESSEKKEKPIPPPLSIDPPLESATQTTPPQPPTDTIPPQTSPPSPPSIASLILECKNAISGVQKRLTLLSVKNAAYLPSSETQKSDEKKIPKKEKIILEKIELRIREALISSLFHILPKTQDPDENQNRKKVLIAVLKDVTDDSFFSILPHYLKATLLLTDEPVSLSKPSEPHFPAMDSLEFESFEIDEINEETLEGIEKEHYVALKNSLKESLPHLINKIFLPDLDMLRSQPAAFYLFIAGIENCFSDDSLLWDELLSCE